jgi:hypothetical protein
MKIILQGPSFMLLNFGVGKHCRHVSFEVFTVVVIDEFMVILSAIKKIPVKYLD